LATVCATSPSVIPAKAGIQTIDSAPRSGTTPEHGIVRYAVFYDELDPGLRRNDGCDYKVSVMNYGKINKLLS